MFTFEEDEIFIMLVGYVHFFINRLTDKMNVIDKEEYIGLYERLIKQLYDPSSDKNKGTKFKEIKNKVVQPKAKQQILAINELLGYLGVDISKIQKTKFIQFLTGREYHIEKAKDTNIYTNLGVDTDSRNYGLDCEAVATQFDNIGLNGLATKIRNGKKR